jgi:AcrR family transcriptional regulator
MVTRRHAPSGTSAAVRAPERTRAGTDAQAAAYERKRVEVLEAAWRCILRVGLENVTMREIAAELRATTGTVVHYFRSKDEILLSALDHLVSAILQDVQARVAGLSGLERLEQMLYALLPVDEEGEAGWRIWLAFLKPSLGSTPLSAGHARRSADLRRSLVEELGALQRQGAVRADIDVAFEANALMALTDGIGLGRIVDPRRYAPQKQKMLVRRHIDAHLAPDRN